MRRATRCLEVEVTHTPPSLRCRSAWATPSWSQAAVPRAVTQTTAASVDRRLRSRTRWARDWGMRKVAASREVVVPEVRPEPTS